MNTENIIIYKVDSDTDLSRKLVTFIQNSSWADVKDHTIQMIMENTISDWESMFAAMDGDIIIGHASVMKTDYYPLPDIYPWISTIFVTEKYRGMRISEKLIEYINQYAKKLGFSRTYIPSEYMGLYEKYGYKYLKDITNYGGGKDHLFVRELQP